MIWNTFLDPRRYSLSPFSQTLNHFQYVLIHIIFWKRKSLAESQPYSITSNLKIVLNKEIRFYRTSFGPSFKLEIIALYHFQLEILYLKYICVHLLNTTIIEISWDIAFLKFFHSIICSKNKIWKVWHELSSFNYLLK